MLAGGHGRGGPGLILERPLLDGAVNLTEVVDARILLRSGAGADEVRDGDGGQEADDSHHDHDFDECEALLAITIDLHVFLSFWLLTCGVSQAVGGYYDCIVAHRLPTAHRNSYLATVVPSGLKAHLTAYSLLVAYQG